MKKFFVTVLTMFILLSVNSFSASAESKKEFFADTYNMIYHTHSDCIALDKQEYEIIIAKDESHIEFYDYNLCKVCEMEDQTFFESLTSPDVELSEKASVIGICALVFIAILVVVGRTML